MPLLNIDNLETPWTPASEEDFTKVRRQLERILEDPHFKGSKRYTRFLRFIVEEALSGNSGGIKERSLGIAVFDRPLDYDTYSDSIVRVAASEVRKRIAQYYDTPGHDHELRIGLPSGSYTPEFRLGRHHASGVTTVHADNGLRTLESGLTSETEGVTKKVESQGGRLFSRRTSIYLLILAAACVGAVLLGRVALRTPAETNSLSALWGPVVEKTDSVVICVGQVSSANLYGPPSTRGGRNRPGEDLRRLTRHSFSSRRCLGFPGQRCTRPHGWQSSSARGYLD